LLPETLDGQKHRCHPCSQESARNDVHQTDAPEHSTVKCISFKCDEDLLVQRLGLELGGVLQFLEFQFLRTFRPV
jgi:hypothetical protein